MDGVKFRLALRDRVSRAEKVYFTETVDAVRRVHKMRVAVKVVRAVLSLLVDCEELRAAAERHRGRLRQASKGLARYRERAVRRELMKRFADSGEGCRIEEMLREWLSWEQARCVKLDPTHAAKDRVMGEIKIAESAIVTLLPHPLPREAVMGSFGKLQATFEKARLAFGEKPTVRRAHDWRKATKDLLYGSEFLVTAGEDSGLPDLSELRALSDVLGRANDLATLRAFLKESAKIPVSWSAGEVDGLRAHLKTLMQKEWARAEEFCLTV